MSGVFALVASFLAFVVPLSIPLFAQRWRSFMIILAVAVIFFAWLSTALPDWLGPFLGGLMLFGFSAGAIAKFVMLVGRRREPPQTP